MSQRNDTGFLTMTAGAALGIHIGVKLDASNAKQVVAVGAGEAPIGYTRTAVASGELVQIKLHKGSVGTLTGIADAAIAINTALYSAASGEISTSALGTSIGTSLEAAAAAGDWVEFLTA